MKSNGQNFFEKLKEARNVAICAGGDLNSLNASVAMALYLEEKHGKKPFIVYTGALEEIDPVYSEYAEIRDTLANKKLKIIINYKNTDISTLQWEKEDNEKLVMELGPVNRGFSTDNIQFETVGQDVDMIITMGIKDLSTLGDFYAKNQKELDESLIVNIDNSVGNTFYGGVNIVNSEAESIIALLMRKFADWKYTPTAAITSIMLYGLNKHRAENNMEAVIDVQKSTES